MELDELLKVRENINQAIELIDNKILQYDWRHLVARGQHILAVRAYMRQNEKSTLSEAREACIAFRDFINTTDLGEEEKKEEDI